jgi:hypothetical protein
MSFILRLAIEQHGGQYSPKCKRFGPTCPVSRGSFPSFDNDRKRGAVKIQQEANSQ